MKQPPDWIILGMFIGVFVFMGSFFFIEKYGWWVSVVGGLPNVIMGIYSTIKGYDLGGAEG